MTSTKPTHPDQRYVDALLQNDPSLVREIYTRFSKETLQWVQRNQGNADDAQDIFQEALLAITMRARKGNFQLTCPFGAYLFLVVRGKWFNELKKRKLRKVTESSPDGLGVEEQDALVLAEDTLREEQRELLFQEKFQQLSDRCRELLQLSWKGQKMEAVANQLGISYAYARKKKSECIAALMKSIKAAEAFIKLS